MEAAVPWRVTETESERLNEKTTDLRERLLQRVGAVLERQHGQRARSRRIHRGSVLSPCRCSFYAFAECRPTNTEEEADGRVSELGARV